MKIICQKINLLKSVNISLKAVPSKTTMPILECILIDATTNQIKFTTNDMELGIETIVDGIIEEKGIIALDAKIFYEIIRRLPDNTVTIKTDEKLTATITCEKAKFTIPGKSGEDFAYLPLIEKEESLTISQFTLKEMIRQTIFSIASNETNKLMTGELFEIKNNYLKIVSLDGHRIAIRRMELKKDYTIVMVTHNMQQAVRVSENTGENSEMSFMEDMADNMNLPDKVQDVYVEASDENMQRSVNADDDKWVKYVAQPGDTLFDVFEKSDCDIEEFLNKNGLKGIYILPGLVYFVKEK